MRSFSLQILVANISRQWRKNCGDVLSTMLVLAMLGCTGHDNPFDSDNKLKGEPFKLIAKTGYGKILLEWNWPTYPVEGGKPIPLDSFLVWRESLDRSDIALHPRKNTSLIDTTILGDTPYRYRVVALRGADTSDFSLPVSTFAFPLLLDYSSLGGDLEGIMFTQPTAIGFEKNIKFVAADGNLCVVNANDQLGVCRSIANPTSDMALVRTVRGDSVHIIVCSAERHKIDFLVWSGGSLSIVRQKGGIGIPQAAVADESGKFVFVADDSLDNILRVNPVTGSAMPTSMRTGVNPWRLAVLPNPPRLFCANQGSATVSAFDIATESSLGEIQVNHTPVDIWLGPDPQRADAKLYVVCANRPVVVIIDPLTLKNIGEIPIAIPEKASQLIPRSVTGFADPQNRHQGMLAVLARSGDRADDPAFLLYYSLADRKLEKCLPIQGLNRPDLASFLVRMNTYERRIYTLLTDKIGICQSK